MQCLPGRERDRARDAGAADLAGGFLEAEEALGHLGNRGVPVDFLVAAVGPGGDAQRQLGRVVEPDAHGAGAQPRVARAQRLDGQEADAPFDVFEGSCGRRRRRVVAAVVVEVGRRLYARGYTASNDGNVSVRLCRDSACASQFPGSPVALPYSLQIVPAGQPTFSATPAVALSATTHLGGAAASPIARKAHLPWPASPGRRSTIATMKVALTT